MLFTSIAEVLAFLWRINASQPDFVLSVLIVEHRDGIAIRDADNLSLDGVGKD